VLLDSRPCQLLEYEKGDTYAVTGVQTNSPKRPRIYGEACCPLRLETSKIAYFQLRGNLKPSWKSALATAFEFDDQSKKKALDNKNEDESNSMSDNE